MVADMVRPSESVLVYLITCQVTGKRYVGLTKRDLRGRWYDHRSSARQPNKPRGCTAIAAAIRKYGYQAFTIECLAIAFSRADAGHLEKMLIAELRTVAPGGYNVTAGGDGGTHGRIWSEAERRQVSERWIAFYADPEQRARNGAVHRGQVASAETRAKQRLAKIGRLQTAESNAKRSATMKAFLASEKPKGPQYQKGRVLSAEHIAKLRKPWLNRIVIPGGGEVSCISL